MEKRSIFSLRTHHPGIVALLIALLILSGAFFFSTEVEASSQATTKTIGGCPLFPTNNVWNYDISHVPVSGKSATYLASIGLSGNLHPDFGSGLYDGEPMGFPYIVVPASQPTVPVHFTYASESDPGPYPIPANAPIEGGTQSTGDRHVLVVQRGRCKLYEMYASYPQTKGSWQAGSGASWNLNSNALRPATWTSADAAGLPILPGLVSYDDVASGAITHALRFTVAQTQASFLWPARHVASSNHNPDLPPMGLRLRLKATVSLASFSRTNQIILTALKHYGMFVADNGSSWYLSGTADSRWNNDDLHALSRIPGSDFEVVDESFLEMNANSGQVRGAPFSGTPSTPTRTASPPSLVADTPQTEVKPAAALSHVSGRGKTRFGNSFWTVLGGMVVIVGITGMVLLLRRRMLIRKKSHS